MLIDKEVPNNLCNLKNLVLKIRYNKKTKKKMTKNQKRK
jgi:hypothetical protein